VSPSFFWRADGLSNNDGDIKPFRRPILVVVPEMIRHLGLKEQTIWARQICRIQDFRTKTRDLKTNGFSGT
jgi:hypothetical protein